MNLFTKRRRLRTLALTAILFCVVAAVSVIPVVHEFQLRLADTYFRTAPPMVQPSPVVLVMIDDQSLRTYGRWPWSRSTISQLVRQLEEAGAQIIGLDILFAEEQSPAADGELAAAMRASRRTVLADKIGTYSDGPRWIEPIPQLAEAALGVGHSQAALDGDGICRRFPLRELTVDGPRLAFALEVARHTNPVRTAQFLSEYGVAESDRSAIVSAAPVLAPIWFRRDGFDTISAADVLAGRNLALVRGRPVLVGFGPTEIADRLSTPLTGQLPSAGVEIHAQILDSVLTGRSLRALPAYANALLLFATCFGAIALYRHQKGWRMVVLLLCCGSMSYFVGWAIFVLQSRIPPTGPMLLAVVFGPLVVYAADFVVVERSVRLQMTRLRERLVRHRHYELRDDPDDMARNLDVLQELQTQLGSMYELHETLLESTRDAVAAFDDKGWLILQNRNFATIFRSRPQFTRESEVLRRVDWVEGPPLADDRAEGEAHVDDELFAVRRMLLPPMTLSPAGGTIWMLSSLQAREERDRSRAEVMGFITHELRTPLTAIQGFSELMMQFPGSPQNASAPETIFRESKRLLALIHSYLDVLRLDAGARLPRMEEVRVVEVVRHVLEVMRPIATASGTTLTWLGQDAAIFGDFALLNGAILNVVSNAIKYGEKGTEITVRCDRNADDVTIAVHNFGRQIEAEDLPNLFSSYYRGGNTSERVPGWGLGLAFVKRIAEKHGGRVSASSSQRGTTFSIHLPAPLPVTTFSGEVK